ncbi:MAG: malate synthase A [Myxococcota bacterium]
MASQLEVLAPHSAVDEILTPEAKSFVAHLGERFEDQRQSLLARRVERQKAFILGQRPRFLDETKDLRAKGWTVAEIPPDLQDRRVEITGPVDRKMIINALNSGANVFMADFEDANSPTWANCLEGQVNLRDANRRSIDFKAPNGKHYNLVDDPAVLLVRPRGWHLNERHVALGGQPMSGSLFDFGLYFFHNVKTMMERGTAPYFYLPKLESHLEARLWNEVFVEAQSALGVPQGTIRATVLIETVPASFEMDEILWELRDHSAGLNCGRWDYIFSYIKVVQSDPLAVLPDRAQVGMTQPFMRAYSQRVIQTCHRRGVHAMGGMAAQIPIKSDPSRNEAAMEKVRGDKLREVQDGHDGTWVAHPGLVPLAKQIFDEHMSGAHQFDQSPDVEVTEDDLLRIPEGTRTEAGLSQNISVGIQYMESWLRGAGCVPLYDLMEDAATAEISRSQVWQWVKHGATLENGRTVSSGLVRETVEREMKGLEAALGSSRIAEGRFSEARALFEKLSTAPELESFLTLPAYEALNDD